MAISSTTFNKDSQPSARRGRSNKTLILEMFREKGLLELGEEHTKEDAEKAFFHNVALSAFNLEDSNRGMCLKLLGDKGWASVKASSEVIYFDFDETASPHEQAAQVMKGIANGEIPPDLGGSYVNTISSMLNIQDKTDFEERLKAIEDAQKQD